MHFLTSLRLKTPRILWLNLFSLAFLMLLAGTLQAQGSTRLQPRGSNPASSSQSTAASTAALPLNNSNSASNQASAPRAAVSMTQSTSTTVVDLASIACATDPPNFFTRENSYYRTFKLSDFSITEPLIVNKVSIGVELATPGTGLTTQPLTLKLYSLTGAMAVANLTLLSSTSFQIPSLPLSTLDLPVNTLVTADQTLVVEIYIPEGSTVGHLFYLGANTAGETSPSYIRAPACSINDATDISTIDLGQTPPNWVMTVYGETQSGTSFQLLNNGDFEYDIDSNKQPEAWSGKNLTKDKLKKNKDGEIYAFTGEYAFVFKSAIGEKSAIQQAINLEPYTTAQNDTFALTAAVRGKNLNEGAVIKINLTYQGDEKPLNKVKLVIPPGTYEYDVIESSIMTLEKAASKIKVQVLNKSTTGRFLLDAVTLTWGKPAAAAVLPLP